jgi:hypothetical protein
MLLPLATTVPRRDVEKGRELLRKAREGFVASGRMVRVKDVDAELAAAAAPHR